VNNAKERTSPLTAVIMIPIALIVALPLYYIVVNTFKTQAEMSSSPFALPTQLFLDNYATVFGTVPLVQSFANTLFVTVVSLVLMLIIGSMAAYGMIIGSTRFTRWFGAVLVLGFIIPSQSTLIPLYRLLVQIRLIDTLSGLVLLYSAGSIFCYFLIQGYMKSIPYELVEAARIDGASEWQVFWHVTRPRLAPIMMILVVLRFGTAMAVIDEYLIFGGFNRASPTYTWTMFMYDQAFHLGLWRQGYGAAIGMIGAIAMMIVMAGLLWLFRPKG